MKKTLLITFILLLPLIFDASQAFAKFDKFAEEMLQAEDLLNQSKTQQAEAVYLALITKNPQYEPALLALGTIYSRKAEFIKAEKIFLNVINTNKKSANGYERLAYNYYLWSILDDENSEFHLKKALEAIKKAQKLDKYNENIYTTYSLLNIEYKLYDKALQNLHKAQDINPINQDVFTNLGILYTSLNKYELALRQFERAINLKSSTPKPYKELGIMLAKTDQHRQAVDNIKKGQFYDIYTSYKEHYLLGTLYEKLGELNKAIEEFTATLTLKPGYIDCYTNIARLFEALGEDDKSIEAYRKAVALDYGILEAFIAQAQNYLMAQDYIHARNLFKKVLKIEPGNRYGFEGLCSMHYFLSLDNNLNLQDWHIDKQFLEKHLPEFKDTDYLPQVSWIQFNMAKQGLNNQLSDQLYKISTIDPISPEDFSAKGESYFLLGKYFDGYNYLEQAINKYVGNYSQENSYNSAANHLNWSANRLYYIHELIASKLYFDKIIELTNNNNAVKGLSSISQITERGEELIENIFNIDKTPDYEKKITERIIQAIKYYPENAKAHYLLSKQYAKNLQFDLAIDELKKYAQLADLTPFRGQPKPVKIQKLIKKYTNILDKEKYKLLNQQSKQEEKELLQLLKEFNKDLENAENNNELIQ